MKTGILAGGRAGHNGEGRRPTCSVKANIRAKELGPGWPLWRNALEENMQMRDRP